MAYSTNFGAATGTSVNVALKPWNYTDAFRVISDNGQVAKMTDILAPLGAQTTVKIATSRIADVYTTLAAGSVPVSEQSATMSGQSTYAELNTILSTGSGDTYVASPARVKLETKLANDSEITDALVMELIMATVAILCDSLGASTVVSEKMRGALTPAGI